MQDKTCLSENYFSYCFFSALSRLCFAKPACQKIISLTAFLHSTKPPLLRKAARGRSPYSNIKSFSSASQACFGKLFYITALLSAFAKIREC
jgi:hypothetical protein